MQAFGSNGLTRGREWTPRWIAKRRGAYPIVLKRMKALAFHQRAHQLMSLKRHRLIRRQSSGIGSQVDQNNGSLTVLIWLAYKRTLCSTRTFQPRLILSRIVGVLVCKRR